MPSQTIPNKHFCHYDAKIKMKEREKRIVKIIEPI
jgi:hypothetical protein